MKILLLGEASNLHWTLSEGLRSLGHKVTVISNGSVWMNNNRDINLKRKSYSFPDTLHYAGSLIYHLKDLTGYDIVQINHPCFLDFKASTCYRIFRFLKKHNKKIFLGAFGTDHYWVKHCLDKKTFRYSDFYIGDSFNTYIPGNEKTIQEWMTGEKAEINKKMAEEANGISCCLYEYYISYYSEFKEKAKYLPLPINLQEHPLRNIPKYPEQVQFFIGIQKDRNELKGTDRMLNVLQKLARDYPDIVKIAKAVSVPYQEYKQMMYGSDILLDQLYSYTPGMNGLIAMAKGLVVIGGGEPEMYDLMGEQENRPIINVLPDEQDIYQKAESLIMHRESLEQRSLNSRHFVEKHHDHIKVVGEYLHFWESR